MLLDLLHFLMGLMILAGLTFGVVLIVAYSVPWAINTLEYLRLTAQRQSTKFFNKLEERK